MRSRSIARNDVAAIEGIKAAELQSGNAETLNWIAAAGALEHLKMELVDYVPGYRSIAGTGTEDFINDGWGFRELTGPYYGVTNGSGFAAPTFNRTPAYCGPR